MSQTPITHQAPAERLDLSNAGDIEYSVRFFIAGFWFFGGDEILDQLMPGTPLRLVPEPDNPHDCDAVAILTMDGIPIGHVPRFFNRGMAQDLSWISAVVESVNPSGAPWSRLVVRLDYHEDEFERAG